MFNTVSVKENYRQVFQCGNPNSKEVVLILGSCRVVPFVNYLNVVAGNRFQIRCIDPINYSWDEHGKEQDSVAALKALETNDHVLSLLESVTIFIHEGLSSYGILNTLKDYDGRRYLNANIYQFGMSPQLDINIPNFHDVFILFNDFAAIYPGWRKELNETEQCALVQQGNKHIERFCGICKVSSFPEFAEFFMENFLKVRLFHSFNHVSSAFTLEMFRLMNEKFLKLKISPELWAQIGAEDMFANRQTPVTDLDRKWRPFQWM